MHLWILALAVFFPLTLPASMAVPLYDVLHDHNLYIEAESGGVIKAHHEAFAYTAAKDGAPEVYKGVGIDREKDAVLVEKVNGKFKKIISTNKFGTAITVFDRDEKVTGKTECAADKKTCVTVTARFCRKWHGPASEDVYKRFLQCADVERGYQAAAKSENLAQTAKSHLEATREAAAKSKIEIQSPDSAGEAGSEIDQRMRTIWRSHMLCQLMRERGQFAYSKITD